MPRGEILEQKTEAYIGEVWYTIARNRMTYNAEGKRITSENLAGQVTTTAWDCCHKVSEVQPDGSTTTWDYDDEGRVIASSRLIPLDMTNITWLTTCYEYDAIGRQTGYIVGGQTVSYAYDPVTGRLISVASGTNEFFYTYLPGTDLVAGYVSGDFSHSVSYEQNRDLVSAVTNRFGSRVVSAFGYSNDTAGRRTAISRSGEAFGDLSGATDAYVYNLRSEVVSARRTKDGAPVRGFDEDFSYDPIGNRIATTNYTETGAAVVSEYSANSLNQYTSRTVPGVAAVRGFADANATVTVNENPAYRLGEYFFGSDEFDNSQSSVDAALVTSAVLASPTNGPDEVASVTSRVHIAKSPQLFEYDLDGNQTLVTTKTGTWRVTYNGENRPIRWVRDSDNATLTMTYDHMGRRREKNAQRFFYDGYLQIANFHSTTTTSDYNYFIWDPTEPVATRPLTWTTPTTNHESPITNFYTHDGNKNVSEVIASDNGASAHYEYAPFGAVTVSCGTSAATNPWRFSSEYAEDDTATVYYNYRHYEPVMSRWLSRDPIEELGGTAFYVFCGNGSVCEFDVLGLSWLDFHPDEPPSEVGEWEALIPIYGSLRQFDVATYNGRWGASMWHGLMAVSDVCMVRAGLRLASKGMSACWKTGSHTWRATRSWYGKKFGLEKGVEVHHVYIPQKFIKKHEWIAPIANQPWNLSAVPVMRGLSSKQVHQAIHGCRVFVSDKEARVTFSLWEQYWYSSRHGAEATVLYFSDKLFVDLIMYLEDGATGDVGTDTLERVYDGELKSLQSEVESEEMEW